MSEANAQHLDHVWLETSRLLKSKEYAKAQEFLTQMFDGHDAYIASCLGFIHSIREAPTYDATKARHYYEIAAAKGDTYAQFALGSLLLENGQTEQAHHWYREGSNRGHGACSYVLYRELRRRKEKEASDQYLERAIQQGNPPAVQELAIRELTGRYGVRRVPHGLFLYFKNIPALVRFIQKNVG